MALMDAKPKGLHIPLCGGNFLTSYEVTAHSKFLVIITSLRFS